MLRAVTFDFWDTLVRMDTGRPMRDQQIDGFAAELAASGVEVDRAELVDAFDANWTRFEMAWVANRGQYTAADATDFIASRLGIVLRNGLRDRLIGTFEDVGRRAPLDLAPGADECLRRLANAGLALGIVCDVGLTSSRVLRERLAGFGLLHRFTACSFSDETGRFKPAPEAFLAALEPLGVGPREGAHVGDQPRTDVAGAKALGMLAVRFTGLADRGVGSSPADLVVDDLAELPGLLDLP